MTERLEKVIEDIKFTYTEELAKELQKIQASLNKEEEKTKKVEASAVAYKSVINDIVNAYHNKRTARVKFKDLLKGVKYIRAFNATPAGVPSGENRFCVDIYVKDFVFDILPTFNIPKQTFQYTVNTLTNRQSAGLTDRQLDGLNATAQNGTKRVYNTLQAPTSIQVVKLAYQELVSLEAERSADGIELVTRMGMQKLMEIVHYYILQQLAAGAVVLPAAFYPGAGTYDSPTILDGMEWIRYRYLEMYGTECRNRVHVFAPYRTVSRFAAVKNTTGDYIVGNRRHADKDVYQNYIQGLGLYDHFVDTGKVQAAHALNGANNILIVPSDGAFIYVDSDVIVYQDHLYQTNQTALTFEVFVAASRLPSIDAPLVTASGSISPTVLTSEATILANI